jgi:UDP-N-acetylmuramoyl-tripeptide--D-alanyl-D-alanine ligase
MIYPALDDFADYIPTQTSATPIPVGGCSSPVRALNPRSTATGTTYTLHIDGEEEIEVSLPVPGAHMVSNSLLAAAAGWKLGCSMQQIAAGLSASTLTRGRLACKEVDGYTVVDDTYNANPESMKAALETVAALRGPKRCIAVLGKMGELGEGGIAAHADMGWCAASLGYAAVVVVGPECAETLALCEAAAESIPALLVNTPAEAAAALRQLMEPGDALLFKGSRSAGMERSMYELFPSLNPKA